MAKPVAVAPAEVLRGVPLGMALGSDYVMGAQAIVVPQAVDLVWEVISDTSRVNQSLGLPALTFREQAGKTLGHATLAGIAHEWEELPWSWVEGHWVMVPRQYRRGLMDTLVSLRTVEAVAGGTRLVSLLAVKPHGRLSTAFAKLLIKKGLASYGQGVPALLESVASAGAGAREPAARRRFTLPPNLIRDSLPTNAAARLASAGQTMKARGVPGAAVDGLLAHLAQSEPDELVRIALPELAQAKGLAEQDVIRAALHGTRLGVLDMTWDAICPHCRGPRQRAKRLADLHAKHECPACEVEFDLLSPRSVEVAFAPHPSIRDIGSRVFCSAQGKALAHIKLHVTIAAGASQTLAATLAPGEYRIRQIGARGEQLMTVVDDAASADAATGDAASADAASVLPITFVGPGQELPATAPQRCAPQLDFAVTNPTAAPVRLVVESTAWRQGTLTPAKLLAIAEFRDLFADEYMAADVNIGVGEQTVLFTDVVGSTQFYAQSGDPKAFVEINKHFKIVFAIVATHHGAVIKTIGDAVMAAFADPVEALKACFAIHRAFGPENTTSPLRLRISVHTGPCIAVTYNANIDFFGGTVNVAAKLQSLAETWQVALSEVTYQAAGVAAYFAGQGIELEQLTYQSPVFPDGIAARRWQVFPTP